MARETKVGLLAGLAFIICFAVILTNRGREVMIDRHFPQAVKGFSNEPGGGAVRTSVVDGSSAPARENPNNRPRFSARHNGSPQPRGYGDRGAPIGDSYTRGSDSERASAEDSRRRELEARVAELTAALKEKEQRQSIAMSANPPAARREADLQAATTEAIAPGRSEARSTASKPVQYRVVKGDTLSGIAFRYYGTRSRTMINAIFDANRSILPSPADVQADVTLVLPEVKGFAAPKRNIAHRLTTAGKNGQGSQKGSASKSKSFRWYQIRKNDRYASIARRELGDERRWPELHELNKGKFPDAGKIRVGVMIKIPVDPHGKQERQTS